VTELYPLVKAKPFAMLEMCWIGGYTVARHKLSVAERIIGVQAALASDRTPKQLKPGLRRYLKALQKSRDGRRDLRILLFGESGRKN
jgi:hypothetical protein